MYSVWTCVSCVLSEVLSLRFGQGRCLDLCPVPSYINSIHSDYIPLLQIDQVLELRPAPDHAEKLAQRAHLTSPPQIITVWNTTSSTSGADRTGEPVTTFSSAAAKLVAASVTGPDITGPNVTSERIIYKSPKGTFAPAVFLLHLQNNYLEILKVWNSPEFWTEALGILLENWKWWLFPLAIACAVPLCAVFLAVWLFFWFQVSDKQLNYLDHAIFPQSVLDDERAAEARPLSEILIPRHNNHYELTVELTHEKEQNAQLAEQKQSLLQELSEEKSKNGQLLAQKDVIEIKNQKNLAAIQARIVELEAQVKADAEKQKALAANMARIAQLEAQVKAGSENAARLKTSLTRSRATRKEEKKRFVKTHILGLNRWKNEIRKAKQKCADLEVKCDNLEQKSTASRQADENEQEALQGQINLEKQKCADLEVKYNKLAQKYNNLGENAKAYRAVVEDEQKALQAGLELEEQKCADLEKKCADLEQKYDSIDKSDTTSRKAVEEEKMIVEAELRLEKQRNIDLKQKYDALEANYTGSQEDVIELDGMLADRNDALERSEAARKNLEGDLWAAKTTIGECNFKLMQADDTISRVNSDLAQANKQAADFESKYEKVVEQKEDLAEDYKKLEEEIEIVKQDLREEYDAELSAEKTTSEQLREDNAALKKELAKADNAQSLATAPAASASPRATYVSPFESPKATNDSDEVEAVEAADDTSDLIPEEVVEESATDTSLIDNETSSLVSDGREFYDAATDAADTQEDVNQAADEEPVDAVNDAAEDDVAKTLKEELGISLEYDYDDSDLFGDDEEPAHEATDIEAPEATTDETADDDAPTETIDHVAQVAPEEAAPEEAGNDAAEYSDADSLWGERELQREANATEQQDPQADEVMEDEDKDDVSSMVVIRSLYPTVVLPLFSLLGDYKNRSIIYRADVEWVPQQKFVDEAETQAEKNRINRLTGTHWVAYDERRLEISTKGVTARGRNSRMNSLYNAFRRSACATMGLIEHIDKVQQGRTPEELSKLPLWLLTSNGTNNYWYEKDPNFPGSRRRRHSIAYGDLDETIFKKLGGPLNNSDMLAVKRLPGLGFELLQQQRDSVVARVPAAEQRSLAELFFKVKGSESSTRISGDSKASLTDILAIDNLRQHQVDAGRGEAAADIDMFSDWRMNVTRSIWSKTLFANKIIEIRTLNHLHGPTPSPAKSSTSVTTPLNPTAGTFTPAPAKSSSPPQPVPGEFPKDSPPPAEPNNWPPVNAPTGPATDRQRNNFATTAGTSTSTFTPAPIQVPTVVRTHALPISPGVNPPPPIGSSHLPPPNAPSGSAAGRQQNNNTWATRVTTNTPSPTTQLMRGPFMFGNNGLGTHNNLPAAFTFNPDEYRQEDNDGADNSRPQQQQQQPYAFNPPTGPRAMGGGGRAGGTNRNAGASGSGMGLHSSATRGRVQYQQIPRFGGRSR